MTLFLKIPHWGLFLLLVVFPIIGLPFTMFGVFLGSTVIISIIYLLFVFLPLALFIFWLFSVGQLLYYNLESSRKQEMNDTLFRFNLFYILLYMVVVYILAFITFNSEMVTTLLFLPLNIYMIFCLFYGFYFVSHALAMVEKEGANIGDYIGYFFQLWFFPIGVWIIQPKINKLYEDMS